jgi:hypothetical protein
MRFFRALLFAAVGLIAGGAAAIFVVLGCNAANAFNPPPWTMMPGLVVLLLGPVGGAVAGIVLAIRMASKPPP